MNKATGIVILVFWMASHLWSQGLEEITKSISSNSIEVTGGISLNPQWSAISRQDARRDPFLFSGMANLNIQVGLLQIPFSYTYSRGSGVFRLPSLSFPRLQPQYKWIKLHLLESNLHFSKYTLSNHGFRGLGLELTPGKFRFSGFYGRLRKARIEDYGFRHEFEPHYRRIGYGCKVGYENNRDNIHFIFFRAKDDTESLPYTDSLPSPQENAQVALTGQKEISNEFILVWNYAYSIYTSNASIESSQNAKGLNRLLAGNQLYTLSYGRSAYEFNLKWKLNVSNILLSYERVAPGYRSLGIIQFFNDFERFSIGYQGKTFNSITVNSRFGIERNNLDNTELEQRNRLVSKFQLNIPISKKWSSIIQFSNLQNTIKLRDQSLPFEPVDSLILVNSTFNLAIQNTYLISDQISIFGFCQLQKVNRIINEQIDLQGKSSFRNAMLNFRIGNQKNRISSAFGLGHNGLRQTNMNTNNWYVSTNLRLRFSDPFSITLAGIQNWIGAHGSFLGTATNLRLIGHYQPSNAQQLHANLNLIRRHRRNDVGTNFTEVLFRIGYSLNFISKSRS